jgi:Pyruvate/2-oxoacid:ferredoxin oxidoreductase delta subunit
VEKAMGTQRTVIRIDEAKCDGCGRCAIACAEGAIEIADGKAMLVGDAYCDGLATCIGECPRGAITAERVAAGARANEDQRLASATRPAEDDVTVAVPPISHRDAAPRSLPPSWPAGAADGEGASQLQNWPVRIKLVPPNAPYLDGARLLVAADCVPFAFADFHATFLPGRVVLAGCPQFDDAWYSRARLAQILSPNEIEDMEIVCMDVPCCVRLVQMVREALKDARKLLPVFVTKVGIHGDITERTALGTSSEPGEKVGRSAPSADRT